MSAFDLDNHGRIVRWVDYASSTPAQFDNPNNGTVPVSMPTARSPAKRGQARSADQTTGSTMQPSTRKRSVDDLVERSRCNVPGGCERELTPIPGRQGCCGPLTKFGYAHSTNVSA